MQINTDILLFAFHQGLLPSLPGWCGNPECAAHPRFPSTGGALGDHNRLSHEETFCTARRPSPHHRAGSRRSGAALLHDIKSEAATGYLLTQELRNELAQGRVALLLTQVRVDPNDPAFRHLTGLVGPLIDEEQVRRLANLRRWAFRRQPAGWRLAVPEPEPLAVVETDTISLLLEAGVLVVCGGGGGIPVVADFEGALRGVAAVVPSELTSAVLARDLGADRLVLLRDRWNRAGERADHLATVSVAGARRLNPGHESDRLRLTAACRFVESTGHRAMIGEVSQARAVLDGDAGMVIVAESGIRTEGSDSPGGVGG